MLYSYIMLYIFSSRYLVSKLMDFKTTYISYSEHMLPFTHNYSFGNTTVFSHWHWTYEKVCVRVFLLLKYPFKLQFSKTTYNYY